MKIAIPRARPVLEGDAELEARARGADERLFVDSDELVKPPGLVPQYTR